MFCSLRYNAPKLLSAGSLDAWTCLCGRCEGRCSTFFDDSRATFFTNPSLRNISFSGNPSALEVLAKEILTDTLTLHQLFQFICGGLQLLTASVV